MTDGFAFAGSLRTAQTTQRLTVGLLLVVTLGMIAPGATGGFASAPTPHGVSAPAVAVRSIAAAPAPALPPGVTGTLSRSISPSTATIWTNVSTSPITGPGQRYGAEMVYDAADGYSLLFGGVTGSKGPFINDTWAWENGGWVNLSKSSGSQIIDAPAGRAFEGLTYDSALGKVLLFGGWFKAATSADSHYENDTWTYSAGTWTNITATVGAATETLNSCTNWCVPQGSFAPSMAFDPTVNTTILVGGGIGPATAAALAIPAAKAQQETWFLKGSPLAWTNETTHFGATGQPEARDQASMAWDPTLNEMVLYGGQAAKNRLLNSTWIYRSNAWTNITSWSPVVPIGTTGGDEQGIRGAGLVYDANQTDLVMAGGEDTPATTFIEGVPNTYVFQNQNWTNATNLVGTPPAPDVYAPAAAWDNKSNEGIWTGGEFQFGLFAYGGSNATWAYTWPNDSASVSASPTLVPKDTSVTFTTFARGGTFNYSYHYVGLPPGCTSQNAASWSCDPTTIGAYNVTVYVNDTHHTEASATVHISVFEALTIQIQVGPPSLDLGGSTTIYGNASGGSGGNSYTYTGLPPGCGSVSASTDFCTPRAPASGKYYVNVSVTDSVGDHASAGPVVLTVFPAFHISMTRSVSELEGGQEVLFNSTATGGDAPYSWSWSGLPDGCVNQDTQNLTCLPMASDAGVFQVELNVSDGTGTIKNAFQNITVFSELSASILAGPTTGRTPLTVNLRANTSGGKPIVSYLWYVLGSSNFESTQQNWSVKLTAPANESYTVELWVNDSLNVSIFRSTSVFVAGPVPRLFAHIGVYNSAKYVDAGNIAEFVASASGGLPPYSYSWTPVLGCVAEGPIFACLPTQRGTIFATVVINDSVGDSSTNSSEIQVEDALGLAVTAGDSTTCGAGVVTLTAQPAGGLYPYAVSWTFNDGTKATGSTVTKSYALPGTYSVTANVTDATGATNQTSVSYTIPACGPSTSNSGLTPIEYGGIAGLVILVVIVLAVLVMRSRPTEGEPEAAPPPPEPTPPPADGEEPEFIYGSDQVQSQDSFYVKPENVEESGGSGNQ